MIAVVATSAFFPVASLSPESCVKIGGLSTTIDIRGIRSKFDFSRSLKAKANAQISSEIDRWTCLEDIIQNGLVFRQNFSIRSYEIGANRTVFIETMMNYLQETAINHMKTSGFVDGFGLTPEMCKKNLIWVVTKIKVMVDHYPTLGDVVQVDTWIATFGKNGMRCNWLARDGKTGNVLTRASSFWVLMNKETRRLTKLPDQVRVELSRYLVDLPSVVDVDNKKLSQVDKSTTNYIRIGLTPRWSDLDAHQHVNNVKYISFILVSTPLLILESHELSSIILEYRRECGIDSVMQSLTHVLGGENGEFVNSDCVKCQHFLRLEDGVEIVKAITEWKPKYVDRIGQ